MNISVEVTLSNLCYSILQESSAMEMKIATMTLKLILRLSKTYLKYAANFHGLRIPKIIWDVIFEGWTTLFGDHIHYSV